MKHSAYLVFLLACCGCATIFKGSTEDVPVIVPEGTVVTDAKGNLHPIIRRAVAGDSGLFVNLRRNDDYLLTFTYREKAVTAYPDRKVDVAWVMMDLLLWPVLIVDVITGAWHSFDGMKVDFPPDSTAEGRLTLFEPTDDQARRIGGNLMIGISRFFPSDVFPIIPNGFFGGVGYQVTPKFGIELTVGEFSSDLLDLQTSSYFDIFSDQWSYHLGGRYRFVEDFDVTVSGGLSDLSIFRFSSRSSDDVVQVDSTRRSKQTPSAAVGLRYTPSNWFIEAKHILGFSPLLFPNGERGRLQATSINFGFSARF